MVRASSHKQGLSPQGWEVRCMPQGCQVPSQRDQWWRIQEWAHTSRNLHHRDRMKLRRDERCISAPQGHPVPVRKTSGTRRQERAHTSRNLHHRDTMMLRLQELFRAVSGPPGMLPLRTKSWHLGMSHPGTVGSDEARSWRGDVVRSGAGTILDNMAKSSWVIYPTELKERLCHNLPAPWEAEWWVHMRAELVVWETSGGYCLLLLVLILVRGDRDCLLYMVNRLPWAWVPTDALDWQGSLVCRRKCWSSCWREYWRECTW